ncbi:glucosamine-6-phosphate deaminase [Actinobacteria bacterium YIM 96077]|uniref:Glucosamine-6-phosphate deaminase n=2 Tax=Phytoactinopolyspora halophila TaxID=1981511 RepID=A0A329QCJ4_9ACTN|nr:glucosamine-6-phosphate deaminase [Actinobacteria bacterium YIM 96077]RAW10024.1 glucosamine-6-phosphate deaminase [Phytoactinopolyspora halophila]
MPPGLAEGVSLRVGDGADDVGRAAAAEASRAIRDTIGTRGRARVIFASAPSQESMLAALVADPDIDWSRVDAFHMDEYVGLHESDPRSFGQWIEDRLPASALGSLERIRPGTDAAREAARYAALISAAPVDLTCMGIGVNGHIAFNEPGDTRFDDPERVRVVTLDPASRQQQVDEALFDHIDEVPATAVTLTVPALLAARSVVVTVVGQPKSGAVASALTGPLDPSCPASAIRMHAHATVHADVAAASDIPAQ